MCASLQFLAEHRIAAPKIYFHDAEEGLIWIEDLGESDLFSFRDDTWLVRSALYRSAMDEIAKLHDLPRANGPSWMAKCHRNLTPLFIGGSRNIFLKIVSAEFLG